MDFRVVLLVGAIGLVAACDGDDGSGGSGGAGASGGSGGTAGSAGGSAGASGGSAGNAGTSGVGGGSGGTSGAAGVGGGAGASGAAGAGGSAGGDAGTCPAPSDGLWATFSVVSDVYRANITNANGIQQAIDLWTGKASAKIPNGKLVCSPAPYNCGWSFHQDPATIEFADFTIELCDGTPSYVEANCMSFGAQYCPWSANLIELRDCRTDKSCPLVPKN